MSAFTFKAADIGYTMNWTVTESGSPLDLTGTTVTIRITGQAARTCTLVTPASGTCRYTTLESDFAAGIYAALLRIDFAGGARVHSEPFTVNAETSP